LIEIIVDKIDFDPQFLQEIETIIIVNIIVRIEAIDGNRKIVPAHLPDYWCHVIYVIECSNEK
jgi:hypothetical protein